MHLQSTHYSYLEKFKLVLGGRADYHTGNGWMFTPRMHGKFNFNGQPDIEMERYQVVRKIKLAVHARSKHPAVAGVVVCPSSQNELEFFKV